MTSIIANAISKGFTAKTILGQLANKFPQYANTINTALFLGYSADNILKHLSKSDSKDPDQFLTEREKYHKNISSNKRKAALEALGVLGTTGAIAAGGLALASRNQSLMPSQILPPLAQRNQPRQQVQAPLAQRGLPAPAKALPAPIGQQPNIPPIVPPNVPQPPTSQTPQAPQAPKINASQILTNAGVTNLIDTMGTKNTPEVIAETLKILNKKAAKNIENAAPGIPLQSLITEYMQQKPPQEQQLAPPQQPLKTQSPIVPQQEQPIQQQEQQIQQKIEPITSTQEPTKTIGNLALLPDGNVGKIEDVRQGIAKINVNGKESNRKLEDLELAPDDLENATREIINKIPEGEKSTALMSAMHIPIPGIDMMLAKFWDGKIAWYLDVPEETYKSISLGLYEPKGQAKTGIGEYKPGVIDSRGAGFHNEIKINQKYSKENKGKTWGYATNLYDALNKIQPILHKISKERYDEQGKVIEKKSKPRKKNP